MNVSFYIAKRYLIAKKSQNAINVISWISVISISIGTFALVVVLSAFNGLESLVESLFESFDSDIRIEANEGKVFSSQDFPFEKLDSCEGVANYSRVLEEVCGARYKQQDAIIHIKGVDDSFLHMSQLGEKLIDGELLLQKNEINYAISGYGIASQLGMYLSNSLEYLTIYAPKRNLRSTINPADAVYKKLIVPGGVFFISPEYDNKYVVVPIQFAWDLLKYTDEVSSIEVNIDDNAQLEQLTTKVKSLVGESYQVSNRMEFNKIIYKTNQTEKWVTSLILLFILIIAAFNILSSLSMLIIEKKRDIATLKSLGAKNRLIRQIFFTEGLLINLFGALTGIVLGVIVCLLQQHIGLVRLEGGIVEFYPVELKPIELLYIVVTVLFIGFLTSWYPVRNLTKISD